MHESIIPMLEEIGIIADYKPEITREDILEILTEYEGILIRSKTRVDEEMIERGKNLKFVARAGAGLDNIDPDAIKSKDIKIINAPEGNRDALAEHTTGMLLSLLNNIIIADGQVRKRLWHREENRGVELMDKTVGIIGYGNMGQAFAKRLKSFRCNVIAYDKYKSGFTDKYCDETDMRGIFELTDILSLHIPLTKETNLLVNKDYLSNFAKPIYLINTSRGEILSLKALKYFLEQKMIKGAALDVLENENLDKISKEELEIFNYLAVSPNVIFSPHIAGWSKESYERINKILVDKIKTQI